MCYTAFQGHNIQSNTKPVSVPGRAPEGVFLGGWAANSAGFYACALTLGYFPGKGSDPPTKGDVPVSRF